ncbi:phosphoglucosamine mutase [Legionella fallonii]|uniref:Phosphoglucosamine mutase n=1 Tax=Legionella fallonii LLAP-10 TaxID=1212491 RepID=A0A098G3I7_9GAMM|nr:phosphoglucosamine mutase [Legionella fallonii]CEG56050.1 phosphoglucosamine mutase [Legionella fallonii LLAP-10]
MSQRKYFGTDGIRGRVGSSNINPEFILKLGWAAGRVLVNEKRKKVVIGKDTRVSGYMLESALQAGLSAAGVDVALLGPMPTPGVAYLTRALRADAGIIISASHNLFEDNGIKFFSPDGSKLADSMESAIENELEKQLQTVPSVNLGKATRINNAADRYIEFCKSTIPIKSRLFTFKIVVDCANGAAYHIAPNVFSELGADVVSMGINPNGFNINQNCGSTAPELLREKVISVGADIGIALDGDGDRVILVDSLGNFVNGDQIVYIIAQDRYQRGTLEGGIVGTLMSNYGLELAITSLGIPFQRSEVGDRYVQELLRKNDWLIGGESSGHVFCLDKTTTADGIVTALQVLAIMLKQDKKLYELTQGMHLLPQILINLKTKNATLLESNPNIIQAVKNLEITLNGDGRILLRASGTEPLLRIMVEGRDALLVSQYAQKLLKEINVVEQKLAEVK